MQKTNTAQGEFNSTGLNVVSEEEEECIFEIGSFLNGPNMDTLIVLSRRRSVAPLCKVTAFPRVLNRFRELATSVEGLHLNVCTSVFVYV